MGKARNEVAAVNIKKNEEYAPLKRTGNVCVMTVQTVADTIRLYELNT
jgi:hypothetical protein